MRILGIDPGYDRVGWAIVEKQPTTLQLVACGAIQANKKLSFPERLFQVESEMTEVCQRYSPQRAIIERLFFATNAKTAIDVAQARGVIVLVCQKFVQEISEPTPMQIKSAVTGNGHADKKAVEKMVRLVVKNVPEKILDDVMDAIAAALV